MIPSTLGFSGRFTRSLWALGMVWVLGGVIWAATIKGPGVVAVWCIWGTGLFLIGWLLIGLPLILLDGRVLRIPYIVLALLAGLGGALILAVPTVIFMLLDPKEHWDLSTTPLGWEGAAFAVASMAAVLYRWFLNRAVQEEARQMKSIPSVLK